MNAQSQHNLIVASLFGSFLVCFIFFCSVSARCHNDDDYTTDARDLIDLNLSLDKKKSDRDKPSSPRKRDSRLYEQLEDQRLDFERKRIKRAFNNIDQLFDEAVIKTQPIMKDGHFGEETVLSLHSFLSLPHDAPSIIDLLEKGLKRELHLNEIQWLKRENNLSFPLAVRILWQKKIITAKIAHALITDNATMTPKEIIRLVEHGASKTARGQFVQLRTGDGFGDTLTLFEDLSLVAKDIKAKSETSKTITTDQLLGEPLKDGLEDAILEYRVNKKDLLADARVIREMRKHFLLVSSLGALIRLKAPSVDFNSAASPNFASVTPDTYSTQEFTPQSLAASLIGNYYFNNLDASTSNLLYTNPYGLTYTGALNTDGRAADWWFNYSDPLWGAGGSYTMNFDNGTPWSNGNPTYLAFGCMGQGWRNNLAIGVSLSTLLANSIGIGAGITTAISRAHDVTYLGQYPIDGKFASIRGLHKIEINDLTGVTANAMLAANFSATQVPVTVAFRATAEFTRTRIYRTHVDLGRTQLMLSDADIAGVLFFLGKKIKETRTPKFDNPQTLVEGDELVETKMGRLGGAFVIALETPALISGSRIGGTVDLSGEFELGLKKLPHNKYEVSIEVKRVFGLGIFASAFNIFGGGYIKNLAIARKQIFIFDFNNPNAVMAYFNLVHHGLLPTQEEIKVYSEDRGPEYLLTEFRAQNEILSPHGIARTYLEKVRVSTAKFYIGFSASIVPATVNVINKIDKETRKSKKPFNLKFENIEREFISSQAKSVATNGLISVRRSTSGGRKGEGHGFNGRYNQDLFVTHRRVHTIDDSAQEFGGNKWQFDSLLVQAQLQDTVITGDNENQMAEKINRFFNTFIGSFEQKDSRSPRTINIEREFSKRDFYELTQPTSYERIAAASQASGIEQLKLGLLLRELKNKHPDHQGLIVKQFIETSPGLSGFSAIHQLLGAKPEHLFLRTESGYAATILKAKKFIASFSKMTADPKIPSTNITGIAAFKKNRKQVRKFYDQARYHLREIDTQLRLLFDDKYLIDDESPLVKIYGKKKTKELVDAGIRQDKTSTKSALASARKTILELLDLESQHFDRDERFAIYEIAGQQRLRLKERVELLLREYEDRPLTPAMKTKYIKTRLSTCWDIITKITDRINKLQSDNVMQTMDKVYVDNLIQELLVVRKLVAKSASFKHLSDRDIAMIQKNFNQEKKKRRIFLRQQANSFHFDGALASTYAKYEDDDVETARVLVEESKKEGKEI